MIYRWSRFIVFYIHFVKSGGAIHLFDSNSCTLLWLQNGRDGVSNHQPHDCLLNRLFRRRSKKTSKLRATGLCEGNLTMTGEFPIQRASNAEKVSIWWRHHEWLYYCALNKWDAISVEIISFETTYSQYAWGEITQKILTIQIHATFYNVFHTEIPIQTRLALASEPRSHRYIDAIFLSCFYNFKAINFQGNYQSCCIFPNRMEYHEFDFLYI